MNNDAKKLFINKQRIKVNNMYKKDTNISAYIGKSAVNSIVDEESRMAYMFNYDMLKANYGNNVESQILDDQIILCLPTKQYIYNEFTPLNVKYKPGTRPILEKKVYSITKDCKSERDKVLKVMRFCRDLYKTSDRKLLFYGGTEEELIKKGEQLCECLGRLMVGLCEVIGIPGRIVMHVIGGHIVSEVYFDGKWAYIDPRCGVYYLNEDNTFYSVCEILDSPGIMRRQSDTVKKDISSLWKWEDRLNINTNKYFNNKEIITFKNYSLMDSERYNFEWYLDHDLRKHGFNKKVLDYHKISAMIFGTSQVIDPGVEFMLYNGQRITGRTMVMVNIKGFSIPPGEIALTIKGEKIYPTGQELQTGALHSGEFSYLFYFDSNLYMNDEYRLVVEAFDEGIGKVSNEVVVIVDN